MRSSGDEPWWSGVACRSLVRLGYGWHTHRSLKFPMYIVPLVHRDQEIDRCIGGKPAGGGDMSGDEHSSDESMIGRDEFEALRQDSANERAVICASVEDLKAEMGVRFAEVLAAVRDRDGGAAAGGAAGAAPALGYGGARAAAGVAPAPMYAGGAAGAAPAPGYGGACATTGVAPAPMYGGANAGYGLHRVESSPGLLQGAGRYGSGGGLGFTPAISSKTVHVGGGKTASSCMWRHGRPAEREENGGA